MAIRSWFEWFDDEAVDSPDEEATDTGHIAEDFFRSLNPIEVDWLDLYSGFCSLFIFVARLYALETLVNLSTCS